MTTQTINTEKTKVKRKAKGLRKHIRRMKQAERKGAMPVKK